MLTGFFKKKTIEFTILKKHANFTNVLCSRFRQNLAQARMRGLKEKRAKEDEDATSMRASYY